MIKKKLSFYLSGRKKGYWFKWKKDPKYIDTILMYAQRGHGKRSSFYSDYTLGIWSKNTVVPIAKAYSGYTDDELNKIEAFTDIKFKIDDKFTLDIAFDQQLFGPVILKSNGKLNLTNDSTNYGEFINSKISLNWKKRSYEFGIFYQPHNEAGGIAFSLFGFK